MKMPEKLLILISFIAGFVSSALGDRIIGGDFGRLIGLACGIGLLAVVYWLNFIYVGKEKADKQKTEKD